MLCSAKSLQSCPALCDAVNCSPPGSSVHGDSPGKRTGVGCHALLQRIFWTQGLNPCLLWLLHCRQILHCSATREALRPKESIAKKNHESDPHIRLQWPVSTTYTVLSPWLRTSLMKHVPGGKIVVDLKVQQLEVVSQWPLYNRFCEKSWAVPCCGSHTQKWPDLKMGKIYKTNTNKNKVKCLY